jgi:cytochrome c oxidase subunit 2
VKAAVSAVALIAAAAGLGGCGGNQSIVSPRSHQTHVISVLWWWMLGAATVVFVGAVGLLVLAWIRRRTEGLPFFGSREDVPRGMVIGFGIVIPLVVLLVLFATSDIYAIRFSAAPARSTTRATVQIVGHEWWWEVRYPGTQAVTANEVHIPARTRVQVIATTDDVIHSLWVPRLARKIDMVPGRENRILMEASQPGTYLGQCSEFCGLQHAHMRLTVVAEPPSAFGTWLANMSRPATVAAGGAAHEGQALFFSRGCAGCHQLRGSGANATVGPDLTHLATRSTLAALTVRNRPEQLAAWIRSPQSFKPGARMPDLGLSPAEARTLANFLDSLR